MKFVIDRSKLGMQTSKIINDELLTKGGPSVVEAELNNCSFGWNLAESATRVDGFGNIDDFKKPLCPLFIMLEDQHDPLEEQISRDAIRRINLYSDVFFDDVEQKLTKIKELIESQGHIVEII